jgi:hydroxymethylbilane synthase
VAVTSALPLRLGTRGSQLALWQAQSAADQVTQSGGPAIRIVVIRTTGDRLQDAPLSESGGKRLFVKEIEEALLNNSIDLAVHSSKDMPAWLPGGVIIGAVLPREDPRDVVVLPDGVRAKPSTIEELARALGRHPSIGTGSVRRIAQLTRMLPEARFSPIRGNLDTRLRKLDAGEHDALVLAAAGLRRLGFEKRISMALPTAVCLPAPGQGIVAIETREDDDRAREAVARVNDASARAALDAERAVVEALGGDCQTPLGALATPVGQDELELEAVVVSLDGSRAVRAHGRGLKTDAQALGASVAADLLSGGADEILDAAAEAGR